VDNVQIKIIFETKKFLFFIKDGKLMAILNNSDNISSPAIHNIRVAFSRVDKMIKEQIRQKEFKKKKKQS